MKRILIAALIPGLLILSAPTSAQQGFFVKPLAEKKVTELPPGDLFWPILLKNSRALLRRSITSVSVPEQAQHPVC